MSTNKLLNSLLSRIHALEEIANDLTECIDRANGNCLENGAVVTAVVRRFERAKRDLEERVHDVEVVVGLRDEPEDWDK